MLPCTSSEKRETFFVCGERIMRDDPQWRGCCFPTKKSSKKIRLMVITQTELSSVMSPNMNWSRLKSLGFGLTRMFFTLSQRLANLKRPMNVFLGVAFKPWSASNLCPTKHAQHLSNFDAELSITFARLGTMNILKQSLWTIASTQAVKTVRLAFLSSSLRWNYNYQHLAAVCLCNRKIIISSGIHMLNVTSTKSSQTAADIP